MVIDTRFAQRGRFGRLLGAIAENPKNRGIGVDEGTAVVVEGTELVRVLGSVAVYVCDGDGIRYSSRSDRRADGVASTFAVQLHVLARGDRFDVQKRRPMAGEAAGE